MPHVIGAALVAAGVYAGARWLMRTLAHQAEEAARMAEQLHRRATNSAHAPKNLGALEYDPSTQVYRPKSR